jgi:hypothetical protein
MQLSSIFHLYRIGQLYWWRKPEYPEITTNVVNLNHAHGEVCSIQHYVIKFAAVQWFSLDTLVSFTNTTDRYDINEILMKVACKHHGLKHMNSIYIYFIFQIFILKIQWNSSPISASIYVYKIWFYLSVKISKSKLSLIIT